LPLAAEAAGRDGVCMGSPGPVCGRVDSERGQGSAVPEGFLVAGFAGQGLMKADSGLRGCLHKAGYTNKQTRLQGWIELPIRRRWNQGDIMFDEFLFWDHGEVMRQIGLHN
jgi:hypothetical protein